VLGKAIEREYNLFDLLRRPGVELRQLMGMNRQVRQCRCAARSAGRTERP
jgi:tRNA uridine 5-carboxymethylaminomethyl modification enzyme